MCAYKRVSPQPVVEGGTGAATLTSHGVLLGNATSAVTATAVGASGTILIGNTSAAPTYSPTPTVTSISFGGSALSTFTDWTSFTPTALGGSDAGTTTYSMQQGYYTRIGNIVWIDVYITFSVATGSGSLVVGALPFTANAATNSQYYGTLRVDGPTFPVGTTYGTFAVQPSSTNALLIFVGTAASAAVLPIANSATTIIASCFYRI